MKEERKKSLLLLEVKEDSDMVTNKDPDILDSRGFVTVLYGDYKQAIFNNWCMVSVLIDNIKKRCACNSEDMLDLADLRGTRLHLPEHMNSYAHNYISQRQTYVLVKINTTEDPSNKKYTSLLEDSEDRYPEISERLNNRQGSNGATTPSSGRKRWSMMRTVSKISGSIARVSKTPKDNQRKPSNGKH